MIAFVYHSIRPDAEPPSPHYIRESAFRSQIDFIRRRYRVIHIDDVGRHLDDHDSALITFDDGYLDNHDIAFRVLEPLRLPFAIFLATGFVDGSMPLKGRDLPFLGWSQIRRMHSSGLVRFGAHTHRHIPFDSASAEALRADIELNIAVIERELGHRPIHFCYPQNATKAELAPFLAERFAFAFQGAGIIRGSSDRMRLNRIEPSEETPTFRLDTRYYRLRGVYWRFLESLGLRRGSR